MRFPAIETHYFTKPAFITLENYNYNSKTGVNTYSQYNYLTPGIGSFLRTRHFEYALHLTKKHFGNCNVIDFGCADGPFLPSLSKYFNHVLGVDSNPQFVKLAEKLVETSQLTNVEVLCNSRLTLEDARYNQKVWK